MTEMLMVNSPQSLLNKTTVTKAVPLKFNSQTRHIAGNRPVLLKEDPVLLPMKSWEGSPFIGTISLRPNLNTEAL